jgi:HSP20 family protein
MSLIRWQPMKELDSLRHQINRLFDELVHREGESDWFSRIELDAWEPAIELKETDSEVILKAEIPGMDAKDLDVQVSSTEVSIAGEHREEKRSEEQGFFHSEIRYGQFQRIVRLPVPVKNDQVKAQLKEGVLTLNLPKVTTGQQGTVKIDLAMQEEMRKAVTEQRQHEEHLQDTAHLRAAAEVNTTSR